MVTIGTSENHRMAHANRGRTESGWSMEVDHELDIASAW